MAMEIEALDRRINNALYEKDGERWWQDDNSFYTLRVSVIPARLTFARRHLQLPQDKDTARRKALEVGCGGGLLTEEIAKIGFDTTGIDRAATSIRTAREHAGASGLSIRYDTGEGEHLPYPDNEFDVVFCCDVLEHVSSVDKVIAEISRVMKPGGSFIFDTFNRTLISKLVVIKLWQEWKRWAFMEPNTHVWDMFITPDEMREVLHRNKMILKSMSGTKPNIPIPTLISHLRKRAKGEWTFKQFGDSFHLVEAKDMNIMYLGFAVKVQP
jgi:2-polyprenyl-6-hydroxyphenyl methylase/3-demethylubiquinone-9 3-methyltransferase